MEGDEGGGAELEAELIAHCRARLGGPLICSRSIDFRAELPRHDTPSSTSGC
jgi:acyl-coenzyme A synthetase/AMP-(fatty) acid ligase